MSTCSVTIHQNHCKWVEKSPIWQPGVFYMVNYEITADIELIPEKDNSCLWPVLSIHKKEVCFLMSGFRLYMHSEAAVTHLARIPWSLRLYFMFCEDNKTICAYWNKFHQLKAFTGAMISEHVVQHKPPGDCSLNITEHTPIYTLRCLRSISNTLMSHLHLTLIQKSNSMIMQIRNTFHI